LVQPDANEYRIKVSDLRVSTLYVDRDQTYHGYSLLMFNKRHVTGLEYLTEEECSLFMQDLRQSANAIKKAVNPDHMNYATLGNFIPHLHYHIIPRYKNDPRWRDHPWSNESEEAATKRLTENEYQELVLKIRSFLK